jgi:putative transposase
MNDPTHKLSIVKQSKELGITRSTLYYKPMPISDADLALIAAMDRLHLDYPFAGTRMLRGLLRAQVWQRVGSV